MNSLTPTLIHGLDLIRASVALPHLQRDLDGAITELAERLLRARTPDEAEAVRHLIRPVVNRLIALQDIAAHLEVTL